MVLLLFALFRAGFEPLSWRGDHGLSLGIKGRVGFLGPYHNPRRGSKPARIGVAKEQGLGRAEFFALPSVVQPHRIAHSPRLPSHLTSWARTRKGKLNGKTIKQSRKTPSSSRLSSEKEKRRQSRETLTIEIHHRETQSPPRPEIDVCL
ncbi:MAG TPA: hypothetical protein VE641_10325 [Chthoniobacterales bacterium]|nr:hypothetical protein [Chthoniobacterales bacterium]